LSCIRSTAKPNFKDNVVTPDGYVVNNAYSVNHPHPKTAKFLLPNLTLPTIGDRLNDAQISWGWYSGGWNDALAGNDHLFQHHHQPLVYFETFRDGSKNKQLHLKDEEDFIAAIRGNRLPSVCFVKPSGENKWQGTIYNADDGRTYSSYMNLSGANMKVKGCVGPFCKTMMFIRTE